jgi:hypothetical protein
MRRAFLTASARQGTGRVPEIDSRPCWGPRRSLVLRPVIAGDSPMAGAGLRSAPDSDKRKTSSRTWRKLSETSALMR